MFKKAGYSTGTFGKWHVTNNPLKDGFDVNIGGDHRGNPGNNGYVSPYNKLPNLDLTPDGENLTDRLTDEAMKFIESHKEKTLFCIPSFLRSSYPVNGKKRI